jgi:hypothetical protein
MTFVHSLVFAVVLSGGLLSQIPSSGLRIWLRADAGVSHSAGRVDSWSDQSGAGHVFTGTTSTRPEFSQDGSDSLIRFQGNQVLSASLPFTLTTATIFARFRYRIASSNNDYLYAFGAPGARGRQFTLSRRNGSQAYHYDGSTVNLGGVIPAARWLVSRQVYGEGSPGSHVLRIDGAVQLNTSSDPYSVSFATARIGDWSSCCYRFWGDLGDLIVYDRHLSAAEIQQVESWLGARADRAYASPFGVGCASSAGVATLDAAPGSRPVLGGNFTTQTTGLAASAPAVQFFSFDDTRNGSVTLPLALDAIGMTGCVLLVSTEIVQPLVNGGGTASSSFAIPNSPALLRTGVYLQSLTFDPPANSFGLALSNGLALSLGL